LWQKSLTDALIGHRYWTVKGADYVDSMDSFYRNLSIMGGFLLLYITDAGKYSIDVFRDPDGYIIEVGQSEPDFTYG
jgi:hypothetical protein